MRCCINCFKADEPRQLIAESGQLGDCDFCDSRGVVTIEPVELQGLFEPVLGYYEIVTYGEHYLDPDESPFDHGELLGTLLQSDWDIFSEPVGASDECNELIGAIFESAIDPYDLWCTVDHRLSVEPDENQTSWNKFAIHLKAQRRFILKLDEAEIGYLFEWLPSVLAQTEFDLPKGSTLFRSRLGGKKDEYEVRPFPGDEMGAPPPDPRRQGRGNPPGISYLYAASDEKIAVAEKRPGRNTLLSLAELRTSKDLVIIDLSKSPFLESPFGVENLAYEINARNLLWILGKEMSRPVSTDDPPLEYLPSQFLCEMILDLGYDGVKYASSYGSGSNYLLFDVEAATPSEVRLVQVSDVSDIKLDFGTIYDLSEEMLE